MISNIPIFRAKKIDGDEYVKGYYFENTNWKLNYEKGDTKCLEHYICRGMPDTTSGTYKVDPTTLAIHFPDMLDSQGNKIFVSLQEDGKGGDIITLENITKTAMWCSKTQAVMLNSKSTGLSILSLYKEDIKVIGIQK